MTSAVLPQILPFLALLLIPAFTLRLFSLLRTRVGCMAPWTWFRSGGADQHTHIKAAQSESSTTNKRRVQTRADQLSTGDRKHAEMSTEKDPLFPGLVNMSGTHCFMNSTLQALASLSTLPPYLSAIRTRAETLDVPTPVVDAFLDLLTQLNAPDPTSRALRATALVEALCTPDTHSSSSEGARVFWGASPRGSTSKSGSRAAALLATHEHQDAQEFFQLLSECVREERARVVAEGAREVGLGLVNEDGEGQGQDLGMSPFDGLTATRRACVRCGYTAAIRHFAFDTLQLPLEMAGAGGGWAGTSLLALLHAYTTLEILQDCPCRRCELRATAHRLADELASLEAPAAASHVGGMLVEAGTGGVADARDAGEAATPPPHPLSKRRSKAKTGDKADGEGKTEGPTPARVRRIKTVKKMHARVVRALEAGRIEEEELEGWNWDGGGEGGRDALKGVRIERVKGGVCTRQSMLGRPPAVLALHINRSIHTGMRMVKNGAHVAFPELLDVAPFTTGGVLSLEPTMALNGRDAGIGVGGDGDSPSTEGGGKLQEECLYRLAAVVCHYGQHSFGHYVCYRRAPVPAPPPPSSPPSSPAPSANAYVPAPPTHVGSARTGTGWLRISDSHVERCGVDQVLSEGRSVFMLYYERVPPAARIAAPGTMKALPRPRVVRSVTLGVGAVNSGSGGSSRGASIVASADSSSTSSSVELRSGSSEPEPGDADTEARALVEEEAVDTLVIVPADEKGAPSVSLPTPPPTPKGSEQPALPEEQRSPSPSPSQTQSKSKSNSKKKKKGRIASA